MLSDEQQIRGVIATWMRATLQGDHQTVLDLMTEDVLFLTPGNEPMHKADFAAAQSSMQGVALGGTSEIEEIEILSDWAYVRSRLRITVTPPGGTSIHRAGRTLTIFKKDAGRWRLHRDANLLTRQSTEP